MSASSKDSRAGWSALRTPLLVTAAWALLLTVFVRGPQCSTMGARRTDGLFTSDKLDLSKDPQPGATIVVPPKDRFGVTIAKPKTGDVLLAYLGPCSECSLRSFDPRKIASDRYSQVLLVFNSEVAPDWPLRRALASNVRILYDHRAQLERSLNAAFYPRFYLLSNNYRLQQLQLDWQNVPEFVILKP